MFLMGLVCLPISLKMFIKQIQEHCFWQIEVLCGTVYSHNSINFTSFKWTHILNHQSENIFFPNIYFDMVITAKKKICARPVYSIS